ncbi:MAG: HD domain-containing protein [Actinobacteria bacterium]|nr:HD domain-containing protein [Actinomycetota bacterium]
MNDSPDYQRRSIANLSAGSAIEETFYLREVRQGIARNGNRYLALKLSDHSGSIEARIWKGTEALEAGLAPDLFVRVIGTVESWRGRLQLNISSAVPVDPEDLNQRDFVPASYRDVEELRGFLDYFVSEILDPDYSGLLRSFFGDMEFMEKFSQAPGDARSHHAYLGGLLEHTVSVATLCQHVTVQHPRLNSDLLMTAALLHDIGKVEEFRFDGRIRYTREGQLLGHVLLGQRLVEDQIRKIGGLPEDKELELLHAIISHHGELEWGAPKRPRSAEALVLHHVDNLDAKVKGFLEVVDGRGEVGWPELQNLFRRPLDEPRAADRPVTPLL